MRARLRSTRARELLSPVTFRHAPAVRSAFAAAAARRTRQPPLSAWRPQHAGGALARYSQPRAADATPTLTRAQVGDRPENREKLWRTKPSWTFHGAGIKIYKGISEIRQQHVNPNSNSNTN